MPVPRVKSPCRQRLLHPRHGRRLPQGESPLLHGLRSIIEAISEAEWTPIPYWMEGAADVATDYTPFESKPDAATLTSFGGLAITPLG